MCGHKFILFSHHQFNTRLRYVHAVPFLVVKFFTMFFSWTVVFHLWGQFSTKGEMIQFSRYPPLAWITLWALTSRDSAHLLFNSNENSFIDLKLCSREKWLICSKPGFLLIQATEAWSADGGRRGKHRLGLGCRAMSLQQRQQCLGSTSDGCGEICVFAHAFIV